MGTRLIASYNCKMEGVCVGGLLQTDRMRVAYCNDISDPAALDFFTGSFKNKQTKMINRETLP